MIEIITILLVVGLTFAVASNEFVERCLGLKLAGDSLAVLMLAYGGSVDNGDVRAASLTTVALTTGLVFLLVVVGRRHFSKAKREA
jgi:hypothetical protein